MRRPPPPHLSTVPLLRGRLHQAGFVASLVAGVVLVAAAPAGTPRLVAAVYAVTVAAMFGTSSVYHRKAWTPAARAAMRRVDHSMILVLIAGTATPLAVLLLSGRAALTVVLVVWSVCLAAVGLKVLWRRCPRWAIHPLALVLGLSALVAVPDLLRSHGPGALWLLVAGVVVYLVGMVVLLTRWPDPRPALFGYHEVFHALTIVGGALLFVVNAQVISQA